MTVTSQRPLKILIRYKKRSLSSISLFLKVKWPSDSIKSGQLPTKCFGFGKYGQYGRGVEGRIVKPCKEGEGRDGGILKNSYHIFGCQGTWCRTSLRYRHC